MPSREEYLVKYEEALLEKLASTFNSLNKDIIIGFSLLLIFLLFQNQLIQDTSIVGTKLKLSTDQSFIFLPILICIIYVLVNNTTLRISKIISLLKSNSDDIKTLNKEARSFIVQDLDYLTEGIAGVQLQLSKIIVKRFLNKDTVNLEVVVPERRDIKNLLIFTITLPFKILISANQLAKRMYITLLWLFLLVVVYIIPLGIPALMLYNKKIEIILYNFKFINSFYNYYLWEFFLLVTIIVYTLISNLVFYSFYFSELSELKDNFYTGGYNKIILTIFKIGKYYKRD